jgi:60 kDa SS-A/Ro ribonucleoprotein
MANKSLFKSLAGPLIPSADARNEERAPAYAFTPKHALAQYASTGCLNSTFYATDEMQLEKVIALCDEVEPEFIARTAVYARERGFMKDIPALLCAVLSVKDRALLARIFSRVIDNGRMLRTFVQIMRSGVVGRKSLGTAPKRLIREWLESRTDDQVFTASVGQAPSIADVVRMVHPRPKTSARAALYAYILGRAADAAVLPQIVSEYQAFKQGVRAGTPNVPFQMLTALDLGKAEWIAIAENASWQMTRMNLNTFARHGVFEHPGMTELIAARLKDADSIKRARVFPYQLMVAYAMTDERVPEAVRDALQDAMEIAVENVPALDGKIYVCPDVSGSMRSPVTGHRKGATTRVLCVDVAALVAAAIVRKNPLAEVLPFHDNVIGVKLNSRDSVMTNAKKLASAGGGGTNCSAPLARLNAEKSAGDLVIFVSDNQSWVDAGGGRGTATLREWNVFRERNPRARLVCLDVQPYGTTQAADREDVLNIGGFSDRIFEVVSEFAAGRLDADHWLGVIDSVVL